MSANTGLCLSMVFAVVLWSSGPLPVTCHTTRTSSTPAVWRRRARRAEARSRAPYEDIKENALRLDAVCLRGSATRMRSRGRARSRRTASVELRASAADRRQCRCIDGLRPPGSRWPHRTRCPRSSLRSCTIKVKRGCRRGFRLACVLPVREPQCTHASVGHRRAKSC